MFKFGRKIPRTMPLPALLVFALTLGCQGAQSETSGDHPSAAKSADKPVAEAPATFAADASIWSFDKTSVGSLPAGWKVTATNQSGSPATWKVIKDTTAPSGDHVLALTSPPKKYGGNFNICWVPDSSLLDGEIQVRFKALKGHVDQGGGVIWRARDKDNYYIARFNPLEDNFRVYTVHNGSRRKIADARVALAAGKWHTMKIVQHGNHFEGYLDGKKYLEGKNDLFKTSGAVGLWTKADAVTSFDDFSVTPLKP